MQLLLECLGKTSLIKLDADRVELDAEKIGFEGAFLVLNGKVLSRKVVLTDLDEISVRFKTLGGGFLWGSSDQEVNKVQKERMQRSFATNVNRAVVSNTGTNQKFTARDITLTGEGNTLNLKQAGGVSAQEYVSQLSKIVDNVKSTLTSQLEASLQNDKSAGDSMTASAAGTPAGGTASGTVGGLVSTASTTANTTNQVESYLNMATTLQDTVRTDTQVVQEMEIRDLTIGGKENVANIDQSARVEKIMQILQSAETDRTAEDTIEAESVTTATMTASGNAAIMSGQLAGAIMCVAFIFVFFGPGGGGGGGANRGQQAAEAKRICQSMGDNRAECPREEMARQNSSKNMKTGLKVIALILIVAAVAYGIYKFTNFMRNLF